MRKPNLIAGSRCCALVGAFLTCPIFLFASPGYADGTGRAGASATVQGVKVSLSYAEGGGLLVIDLMNTTPNDVLLGPSALRLQSVHAIVDGKVIQAAEIFPTPPIDAQGRRLAAGESASAKIQLPRVAIEAGVSAQWCYSDMPKVFSGPVLLELCIPFPS